MRISVSALSSTTSDGVIFTISEFENVLNFSVTCLSNALKIPQS